MQSKKKLKRLGEYWLARFLILLAGMPRRPGRWLFAGLADVASRCFPKDRQRAVDNLGLAFPRWDEMVRRAMSRAMFRALGRNAFEFLSMSWVPPEQLAERIERVEGLERIAATFERGRGMIVITGHIGCWELMPAYFATRGYPVSVVARRMKVSRINDELVRVRGAFGVRTLDRESSPREMLAVLHRHEVLGVLIDQHTSVAGAWVPFFGHPAYTPTAVARLAMLTGASILPMAIYLQPDGRHVVRVLEPITAPEKPADRDAAVVEVTARCSTAIEELVRADPKQWVWFHHRWREQEVRDVA